MMKDKTINTGIQKKGLSLQFVPVDFQKDLILQKMKAKEVQNTFLMPFGTWKSFIRRAKLSKDVRKSKDFAI